MSSNGGRGEDFAAAALLADGYTLLARNYHSRYGELDLVAVRGDILAFVEVKTRAKTGWSNPEAAVTLAKQRRLIATAVCFLEEFSLDLQPRFDVFAIITADTQHFTVLESTHWEGAFIANEQNWND